MAPPGATITIPSHNIESKITLNSLKLAVLKSQEYQKLPASSDREDFIEQKLTEQAEKLWKTNKTAGVLWVNLLRSAGWDSVEVKIIGNRYSFIARKGKK